MKQKNKTQEMKKIKLGLPALMLLLFVLLSCADKTQTISVLQFNIWNEGGSVEHGFEGIVDNILNVDPDMVAFCEIRNYDGVDFIDRIMNALQQKGSHYYGQSSSSTGIISKFPLVEQTVIYPIKNDAGSITKARIDVHGKTVVLYAAHLDYKHYSCYLPRGYDGSTWAKIEEPITDADSILAQGRKSYRLDAVKVFIEESKQEIAKGNFVIIAGDFNEPSHLDWTDETKNLWDHNGAVVEWEVSKLLADNGFMDSYREMYPDVVNYPGFTFPSDNKHAELSKLSWAPESDERDRIDFIYYFPLKDISLKESVVVGPSKSVYDGQRKEETGMDKFLLPVDPWPTDHKGLFSIFVIK